ncbi:Aralkylamine dehydrogenase heavy chain precursor [Methylibium sp. T29-B]|nr:Aralkylamine dehydrogenase heavy chain precursor [Methylibium sp. T29-B]
MSPARPQPAELPVETLSTGPIAASATERVYVADVAVSHISDGRIRVFDARHGRFLGMVSTGYVATSRSARTPTSCTLPPPT